MDGPRLRIRDLLMWAALAALFSASYALAHALRLGLDSASWGSSFRASLPVVLAIKLTAMAVLAMHRSVWRYAGVHDLIRTGLAATLGSSGVLVLGVARGVAAEFIAVICIDYLVSLVSLGSTRVSMRLVRELRHPGSRGRRLLVVGAGDAGEMVVRELRRHRAGEYQAVGFVDDDPVKQGRRIHGLPVLGRVDQLRPLARRHHAEAILVGVCSATAAQRRRILECARATGLPVKRIPSLHEMIAGHASIAQLRDLTMDELLVRNTVRTDRGLQDQFFRGKTVLVTGAAGSIGSELCRQIIGFAPAQLLALDKDENALFGLEHELSAREGAAACTPILGSIRDERKMERVFAEHRPQIVFHAAAYKHVPVLEHFPEEAVRNNVLGTRILADLADRHVCETFVMISTDKAVRPTSVMGASKRVAELIVAEHDLRSRTRFATIRFGNVLGSNGSVIQLFKQQIARGGPVTVTHPEIQRFFMTIPEAVDLVLFAATMGEGGTYILDMGEQVKVLDMAHHLIRLCGLEPERDIPIVFSGLRPGEKLYEELWTSEEKPQTTLHPSILRAPRPLLDRKTLTEELERLIERAESMDRSAVVTGIRNLVPDYSGEPVALAQMAATTTGASIIVETPVVHEPTLN